MPQTPDETSKLLHVIGLFYDSVLDDAKWQEALISFADFTGGHATGYVVANPSVGAITQCESVNVDPTFAEKYLGYYAQREVRLTPALRYEVGTVLTEEMLLNRRELERSEIYGDLLLPYEVPHFMFSWLLKTPTAVKTLAIEGTRSHGRFTADAVQRFSLVIPHLIRAVRMREVLQSALQSRRAFMEVVEALPVGVILLDHSGRVLELTRSAERLLRSANGITQMQQRVHATLRDDDRKLQRAVNNALQASIGQAIPDDTVFARRIDHRRPLRITAIPVSTQRPQMIGPLPSALMLIVDPEQSPTPNVSIIQYGLQLTRAEAELANVLFTGVTLREAAAKLDRSINTCKTHLKSIYDKTGCRSHVDLAKALMMTVFNQSSSSDLRMKDTD